GVAAAHAERREEAEQRDQIDRVAGELRVQRVVEGLDVGVLAARDRERRDAAAPRALEPAGAGLRRQHADDPGIDAAGGDLAEQVLEARALAGEQDGDAERRHVAKIRTCATLTLRRRVARLRRRRSACPSSCPARLRSTTSWSSRTASRTTSCRTRFT